MSLDALSMTKSKKRVSQKRAQKFRSTFSYLGLFSKKVQVSVVKFMFSKSVVFSNFLHTDATIFAFGVLQSKIDAPYAMSISSIQSRVV